MTDKLTMPRLAQMIDDFALLTDWEDRYQYILDAAKALPAMEDTLKVPAHLVAGCMSQVWFVPVPDAAGRFHFLADSDALLVRGLIAVLAAAYDDVPMARLKDVDIEGAFEAMGLAGNLSPNRRNGFFSMVERIRTCGRGADS